MPGRWLASWKYTSKVMGGLFASWGPDDWLAKTSNLEETNPGDDSSDTWQATNNHGCEHLWKGTEILGTPWVWKWEHCGQVEIAQESGKYTHLRSPAHIQVSQCAAPAVGPWSHLGPDA